MKKKGYDLTLSMLKERKRKLSGPYKTWGSSRKRRGWEGEGWGKKYGVGEFKRRGIGNGKEKRWGKEVISECGGVNSNIKSANNNPLC